MDDIDRREDKANTLLGQSIRELRRQRGLSIEALAASAGLSVALVSKIERNLVNPSITSLRKLSKALEVPTAFFFAREMSEHIELVAVNSKRIYSYPRAKVSYTVITSPISEETRMFMIEALPGAQGGTEAICHRGFEQGMVIEGELEITVGENVYHLRPLDTIFFPSAVPHRWRNTGSVRCRSIWVISTNYSLAHDNRPGADHSEFPTSGTCRFDESPVIVSSEGSEARPD